MKKYFILGMLVVLVGGGWYVMSDGYKPSLEGLKEQYVEVVSKGELQEGRYLVNVEESVIGWSGSKSLKEDYVNSGEIKMKFGEALISEAQIMEGSVIVDMNSIETLKTSIGSGFENLTEKLKSEDFFDVEEFPEAEFVVIELMENGVLKGEFIIKGVSQKVEVPIEWVTVSDSSFRLLSVIELDRTVFGITTGSGKFFSDLGDNVISDIFILELDLLFEA